MNICEEGPFSTCGKMGVGLFHRWRAAVIGSMAFLTMLNFVLVAVASAGSSYNSDVVKSAAWTLQIDPSTDDSSHTTVVGYFGLREAYYPASDIALEYQSCSSVAGGCNDCYLAGKKAATAVGFAIAFAIILFILNCLRICIDRVVFKVTLLVFAFMNFICLASAMGVWNNQCVHNIEVDDNVYELAVGPGLAAVAVSFVFNFVSFWINLLIPTKDTLPPADLNNNMVAPVGVVHNNPNVVVGTPVYGQPQPSAYSQPVYAATGTPAPYTSYGNKV
jgi:hypothetical protein